VSASASFTQEYKIGDRVSGKVYRILSDRILLHLPGDIHGIIRQREMSWEDRHPDPYQLVTVDQEIDAIVVGHDIEGRSIELSLRLTQRDPWMEFGKTCKAGDIVDGIVQHVREFGAFVEIQPGIEGMIHVSEISTERVEKAHQALWAGDHVVAIVKEIDPSQRRLTLSIRDYLKSHTQPGKKQAREDSTLSDFLDAYTLRKVSRARGDIPQEVDWPEPELIRRVLIVDDHEGFRTSLAQLLQEWGYIVVEVDRWNAALEKTADQNIDLAILDLYLSEGPTVDLAAKIRETSPQVHILILSGLDVEDAIIQKAHHMGVTLEYKPIPSETLVAYLRGLENTAKLPLPVSEERQPISPKSISLQKFSDAEIEEFLRKIMVQSEATKAVLFRESHEQKGSIEWLYPQGLQISESEETHNTLIFSPVGDVLLTGKPYLVADARKNPGLTKYLYKAVAFQSCVGIPVQVPDRSQPFALFLFEDTPGKFSEQTQSIIKEYLSELALLLFRHSIFDKLLSAQGELLRSQLRAGALHDVRNSLGDMQFKLTRLAGRMNELEDSPSPKLIADAAQMIGEVQSISAQMKQTLDSFRDLGQSAQLEDVDINTITRRSVERLSLLAHHYNVALSFSPDHTLPLTHLNSAHIQQIMDNVLLNAIQWCAERRIRIVEVVTKTEADSPLPTQVRISDSGPGIHYQLQQQRIFELGFSTRKGGSGLGLFVARALIDAMHGQISVERSIMEIGTTFLIELPDNMKNANHNHL